MKRTLRLMALIAMSLSFAGVLFSLGYYRGYQDRATIMSNFGISVYAMFYRDLQRDQKDLAMSQLKSMLFVDRENLKSINQSSLKNFLIEFPQARGGTSEEVTSKQIARASAILDEPEVPVKK